MKKFSLYVTVKTTTGNNTFINVKNLPKVSSNINIKHLLSHLEKQSLSIKNGGKYEILDVILGKEEFEKLQKEVFSKQQSFFRDAILISNGSITLMRFVNEKLH